MTRLPDEIQAVYRDAELLYDPETVRAALDRMALELERLIGRANPIVVCVMTGGLVPTAQLISRFGFPHQLDYLHVSRYQGGLRGGEIQWHARPRMPLRGRTVLVVDDILDEGITLGRVRDELLTRDPERLLTAVLVSKRVPRRVSAREPDVVGLEVDDRYVFGCGMDYREYFRNLQGIYAVGAGHDDGKIG